MRQAFRCYRLVASLFRKSVSLLFNNSESRS